MTLVEAKRQRMISPSPESPPPLSNQSGAYGHIFPFMDFKEMFQLALVNRDFYGDFNHKICRIVEGALCPDLRKTSRPHLTSWLREYEGCGPAPALPLTYENHPTSVLVKRVFRVVYHIFALLSKEQTHRFLLETPVREFHCFGPLLDQQNRGLNSIPPDVSQSMREGWQELSDEITDFVNHVKVHKMRSIENFVLDFSQRVLPFLQEMKPSKRGAAVLAAAKARDIDVVRLLLATGSISDEFKALAAAQVGRADPIARLLYPDREPEVDDVVHVRRNRRVGADDD